MGKLAGSSFQANRAAGVSFDVVLRSLDSLLTAGEIEPADFIKIDIEGAEYDALQGATALIRTHRPTLLIEAHSAELLRACQSWLEAQGYRISIVQDIDPAALAKDFRICHILGRP